MKNRELENLYKRKWYYKNKGDFERVKTIELMINVEKRKEKMQKDNSVTKT